MNSSGPLGEPNMMVDGGSGGTKRMLDPGLDQAGYSLQLLYSYSAMQTPGML